MEFLPAGFPRHDVGRRPQILDAAGDVGIAGGPPRPAGAPQWQIEGLRRLEIPEAMQKKFGYARLGAADGAVKSAIFGGNNAGLYDIQPKRAMLELRGDRFAAMKAEYEKVGPEPSNTRCGYVVPSRPIDHSVFA